MEAEILDQVARELKLSRADINRSLSFTNLGGHSLTAIKLMDACKRKGIGLSVGDILKSSSITDLVCRAKPVVVEITESNDDEEEEDSVLQKTKGSNGDIDIIPLKLAVSDVSYAMESSSPSSASDGMDLPPSPERTPMSEMQLSLIRGSYAHPGHNIVAYHQTCYRRELPLLKNAWQQVIESESIFDTEFVFHDDGGGYLVDTGCVVFPWTETTVMDQDALHAELLQPPAFSDVGYAFRAISISPAANDSTAVIVWHVHHALVDGFSIKLLLRKVARAMSGLPVVPGPSFAHLAWEREKLIRQRHLEAVAYWDSQKDNLAAASSQIRLPSGNDDDGSQKLGFWNELATFPVDVSAQELIDHAQRHGITVAATYYAAWVLVLSVFCDSSSVLFGAVMSGRILPIPGILEVVGNLVNTLPIAITIDERVDTVTFLRQVFSQLVDLSPYDWSVPEHGYDRQFSSVLAMQLDTANLVETTATSQSRSPARMNSEFPLSLTVEADGTIQIQFSRQKYRPQDVEYMGSCFARTLRRLIKPHDTIGTCLRDMLSLKTSQKLFLFGNCFSGMTTETSAHEDLVTLLTRAVSQYPDAVAVKQAEQAMSYRQLDLWSDQVAMHLEVFVKRGDIVCVHADPSIYWIVAIYGILKAGAVYCPLNATFTCDVRKTMFELSGAAIYLTPSVSDKKWQPQKSRHCWAVEELLKAREQAVMPTDNDDYSPNPSANAYLCFTSGSTGTPKGVLCTHRGLVAFQRDLEVRLFAQPGQSIAQIMSVSFDGSIHEIFSALSYGATLVLPNAGVPFAHLQTVDTCILTPSLAKILDPDDFSNLINVYLVGEPVPQEVNDRWGAKTNLYNMYGPTEATCGATIKRLRPGRKVTIGRPNPSTRIYILDRQRRLMPPGVMGQIYLAGVQVSNGYLNESDLSQERFFPDSICHGLRERMYATGDIGYWNAEGEIVCLGRHDRQIKLRGFRLDLDGIETRIAKLPGITAAAVTVVNDDDLVAMIQPRTISVASCREELLSQLPTQSIPRYIVPVDQFPMTTAGKLNYKEVAKSVAAVGLRGDENGPPAVLSMTEKKIAAIWCSILKLEKSEHITSDANFTVLGGHSLLQLRLARRLSMAFLCTVPLRLIIETRTLRDLAREIEKLQGSLPLSSPGTPLSRPIEPDDLSPMEVEWVAKYLSGCSTTTFNVSFACHLDAVVDVIRLAESWDQVFSHHQLLRSKYLVHGTGPPRRAPSDQPPGAQLVAKFDVWKEINHPFEISRGQLIRVLICPTLMLMVASHIICDLTTLQLLLDDVIRLYHGAVDIQSSHPVYRTADAWNRVPLPTDLAFWTTYMDGAPSPDSVAGRQQKPKKKRSSYQGSSQTTLLPTDTARAMAQLVHSSSVTFHQLVLAAVAFALQPEEDSTDIVLGGPYLNRSSERDLETIGLFLEPFPICIRFDDDADKLHASSFLRCVQDASQAALSHVVPWQDLLNHLRVTPDFPNHPLFEVMVTFHDRENGLDFALDGATPLYTWAEGAKFGLMCEFTALADGGILLRLEFDEDLWTRDEILQVERLIVRALDLIVSNVRYADIKTALRDMNALACSSVGQSGVNSKDLFLSSLTT